MSIKKLSYWFTLVFPIVDFCKWFAEQVRLYGDARRYLEEYAEFNKTLRFDYNPKNERKM